MTEDKLRLIHQFLNFFFSPWGAAKSERWEWFVGDAMEFSNAAAERIIRDILAGAANLYQWEALKNWSHESHEPTPHS